MQPTLQEREETGQHASPGCTVSYPVVVYHWPDSTGIKTVRDLLTAIPGHKGLWDRIGGKIIGTGPFGETAASPGHFKCIRCRDKALHYPHSSSQSYKEGFFSLHFRDEQRLALTEIHPGSRSH